MSRIHLFLILCLASLACQSQILPIPTETPTVTPSPTQTPTAPPNLEPTLTPIASPLGAPAPLAHRVLILSIDGFRPDAMPLAPMPFLMTLLEKSAYSLTAQTVYPSVTLVAHTSMLSGQCPAKHKVDWNDYIPENGYAQVTDIFDIAHQAGMQTVMYVGKEKLQQITEPASLDVFKFINDRDLVITEDLIQNFPVDFRLMFVHFPTPDFMGHEYGWLSPEQLSVLFRADQAIEKLVTELENRGLREETLFIITADHGGHDTTHGYSLPEDMTIPWIAFGQGIQPAALNSSITTIDTASTAAFALGLSIPPEWDGVPVYEAFGLPLEKAPVGCVR